MHNKKKDPSNRTIVEQYFECLQSKDIEGLRDLFWSDAILYEPFSKLEQGLKGWTQIEPFLKVAIMASESLSREVTFERSGKKLNNDSRDPEVDNINNYDIVETFVTFQKDNIIKAKFRFELSNHANITDSIDRKKIKALNIQFI